MIYNKHNYLEDCCVQYFMFILDDYLNNMHLSCFFMCFYSFIYLCTFPTTKLQEGLLFNLLLREKILHCSIYPAYVC